jgi:hypothetical protein
VVQQPQAPPLARLPSLPVHSRPEPRLPRPQSDPALPLAPLLLPLVQPTPQLAVSPRPPAPLPPLAPRQGSSLLKLKPQSAASPPPDPWAAWLRSPASAAAVPQPLPSVSSSLPAALPQSGAPAVARERSSSALASPLPAHLRAPCPPPALPEPHSPPAWQPPAEPPPDGPLAARSAAPALPLVALPGASPVVSSRESPWRHRRRCAPSTSRSSA